MIKNPSHTSHETLNKLIFTASTSVRVSAIYRHYKYPDRKYKVIMLAVQEATEKICVIYHDVAHDNSPAFVRDLDSWLETVHWEGEIVPRFTLIESQ
ncbi:MAG: DUF1653 domain-containing protein [Candidatus Moraniibacteriota bacterium]|nr:MAG: DUF1653 domain-containing protein [Candidatus Moranbacteria bacterium]